MAIGGSGTIARGEIHWIDWTPNRGSEQAGRRPGLIISVEGLTRAFNVCTVIALTTQQGYLGRSKIAIPLPRGTTSKDSVILPWQLMTVSVERLDGYIAIADEATMKKVDDALRLVWGL